MPYTLKIFTCEDVSPAEKSQAAARFKAALNEALGDAALVLPVYTVYSRLYLLHGDHERPWPISAEEQLLADQWEAAELAATHAAFGVNRYLGDADFEISA